MRLNRRQIDILRWIAEGTPEREWPDWTHRSTAKTLQARGLVKVRGHGQAWTAVITDLGRRVLAGEAPAPDGSVKTLPKVRDGGAEKVSRSRPERVVLDPVDLVSQLLDAPDQTLRIREPDGPTRAGYRRALAAVPVEVLPAGKRVTHTGRDHGDLVIRLVDRPDPVPVDPAVPLPDSADPKLPTIKWLAHHPGQLKVADVSRDRALRITAGLSAVLAARGHKVAPPTPRTDPAAASGGPNAERTRAGAVARAEPDPVVFEVTIGGQVLAVELFEEKAKVTAVPAEEAEKLTYEWQRAAPVVSWKFNGRLALAIHGYPGNHGWADRQRWTLESRLPRFVSALEQVAQARADAQHRAAESKQRRRTEWEEALPKAWAGYVADLNRSRLEEQLDAFRRASDLRTYADAVTNRATTLEPDQSTAALAWAEWIRTEADRYDPTRDDANLRFVEPEDVPAWKLDKYMPQGFTASRPPG